MSTSTTRSPRGWLAAALALLVLVGAGVVLVLHTPASAAPPVTHPSPAGPAPSEAKKAIGRPPRVESPKTGAPPSVLGTVLVLRVTGRQLEVRPTAADTGGQPSSPDKRLVRVQVSLLSVTGSVPVSELDFALVDQDGKRYPSRPALAYGDVPRLGSTTLAALAQTEGAAFFEVPTRASSLVLAYLPAPTKVVAGRWLLSAP